MTVLFTARDLLKEIEFELGDKLTPAQRITAGVAIYDKFGFDCRIAPEKIDEATQTIMTAIF
tara:strand:+ start:231 stop:416 length:186 start_codon:yes stop_codon:yes gene_type:complete